MFSFLSPAWLMVVPFGLAGLFMLFRRGGTIDATKISSLFLLKNLQQEINQQRKRHFPIRFFVELLILCLLAALAASIVVPQFARKFIIVIDNSPSMGARTPSGEATLDSAKVKAADFANKQSIGSTFTVWTTSPQPVAIQNTFENAASTLARIEQVKIGFSDDALQKLVNTLAEANPNDEVVIFSDYIHTDAKPGMLQIPITPLGYDPPNLAIKSAEKSSDGKLSITIFANDEALKQKIQFTVVIKAFENNQWRPVSTQKGSIGDMVVGIGAQAIKLPLKLSIEGSEDSNPVDNIYYLSNTKEPSHTVVVSNRSEKELGLTDITTLKISRMSVDDFENAKDSLQGDTIILDAGSPQKVIPEVIGQNPVLNILPTAGDTQVSKSTPDQVASFESGSTLLRYINPSLLAASAGFSLDTKREIFQGIIYGQSGSPLLLAYEANGKRTIVSGMKLLPYEGKKSPVETILLLNCLRWLTTAAPGQQLDSGQLIDSSIDSGDTEAVSRLNVPALYVDSNQAIVARNFFSEQESSLAGEVLYAAPAATATDSRAASQSESLQGFDTLLVIALACILALDLIFVAFLGRYGATSR